MLHVFFTFTWASTGATWDQGYDSIMIPMFRISREIDTSFVDFVAKL